MIRVQGRRKKEEVRRKKWIGNQTPTNFNEVRSQKSEVVFVTEILSNPPKIFCLIPIPKSNPILG
ncbi:MAG: hypothetical protein F6K17_04320 [Okeania sp. SIO3C4]|nr:hypothetical protein [Okeania sp. SIO3C4]